MLIIFYCYNYILVVKYLSRKEIKSAQSKLRELGYTKKLGSTCLGTIFILSFCRGVAHNSSKFTSRLFRACQLAKEKECVHTGCYSCVANPTFLRNLPSRLALFLVFQSLLLWFIKYRKHFSLILFVFYAILFVRGRYHI